ncbi:hypothetical protein BJY59DRAFT_701094 [Rhodotorula toruloides]
MIPAALPFFPCATLTSLDLGHLLGRWDPAPVLRFLPECLQLRHLTLRSKQLPAHPGAPMSAPSGVSALPLRTLTLEFNGYNNQRRLEPPPSFAPIEAIFLQRFFRLIDPTTLTSLTISFHARNFGGVSKWISGCVNLRSLIAWMQDGDLTPYTSRLTSMIRPLRQLRQLKLRGVGNSSEERGPSLSEREENFHALTLSAFLDSLPTTLVMLRAGIWAPAGDCCGIVKAFLRCKLYDSPLISATIDAATHDWSRIPVTATKQQLVYQGHGRRGSWAAVQESEGVLARPAALPEATQGSAEDPWPFATPRQRRRGARWLMSFRYSEGYCETCYWLDRGSWELDGPQKGQKQGQSWWRDCEKETLE